MAKKVAATGPIEGPWALPDGWRWERLGDVCEPSQYGWTTKAASSGDTKFLRTTDISSGRVDWSSVPYCAEAPSDLERYRVKSGDILISRAGSVGKSFLIDTADDAVFASYLIRFRPLSAPHYIHYWLQTDTYWSMISESTAGIAIPNVNASKLSDLPVPMAPKRLQHGIVTRIEELFAEIDDGEAALARARDDLATWRKALLKAAVTGELTADWRAANPPAETGAEMLARILLERREEWSADGRKTRYKEPVSPRLDELPSLPSGWAWATIEQLCNASRPVAYGVLQPGKDLAGGIPLVRVMDVRDGVISLGQLKRISATIADAYHRTKLRGGEVLLTVVGSVGRTAVVPPSLAGANTARAVSVLPVTHASATWIELALRYEPYRAALENSSHEVARKTLNLEDVRAFALPVPPVAEQDELVRRILLEIDAERALKVAKAEAGQMSSTLRQSILAAAFRGELV